MIEPHSSVRTFVAAIARAELAGGARATELAPLIVSRLHLRLAKLIGSEAFDVLVARSVVLARRLHPCLAGVSAGPGGTLTGLNDAATAGAGDEDALAIVGEFFELLIVLIGEDLAMRLVRDVWPVVNAEEGTQ